MVSHLQMMKIWNYSTVRYTNVYLMRKNSQYSRNRYYIACFTVILHLPYIPKSKYIHYFICVVIMRKTKLSNDNLFQKLSTIELLKILNYASIQRKISKTTNRWFSI